MEETREERFERIKNEIFEKYGDLFRKMAKEEYSVNAIRDRDNWTALDYCDFCRQIKCVCIDRSKNF